jgi:hypothetical protein
MTVTQGSVLVVWVAWKEIVGMLGRLTRPSISLNLYWVLAKKEREINMGIGKVLAIHEIESERVIATAMRVVLVFRRKRKMQIVYSLVDCLTRQILTS